MTRGAGRASLPEEREAATAGPGTGLPAPRGPRLPSPMRLAAAAAVAAVAAFVLKSFWLLLGAVGVGAVAAWMLAWRRIGRIPALAAIRRREAELERDAARRGRVADLRQALYAIRSPELSPVATRALRQLDGSGEAYDRLARRIDEKFSPTEITHERFRAPAAEAYAGIVETIRAAGGLLATADGLLRSGGVGAGSEPAGKARAFLDESEQAIEAMARLEIELAGTDTGRGATSAPLEARITELHRLAERAKLYARE